MNVKFLFNTTIGIRVTSLVIHTMNWLRLSITILITIGAQHGSQAIHWFKYGGPEKAATLYLETQFRGLQHKVPVHGGCTRLEGPWNNAAQSIDVHGSCLKLYDGEDCNGKYVQLKRRTDYGAANLPLIGLAKKVSSFLKC